MKMADIATKTPYPQAEKDGYAALDEALAIDAMLESIGEDDLRRAQSLMPDGFEERVLRAVAAEAVKGRKREGVAVAFPKLLASYMLVACLLAALYVAPDLVSLGRWKLPDFGTPVAARKMPIERFHDAILETAPRDFSFHILPKENALQEKKDTGATE